MGSSSALKRKSQLMVDELTEALECKVCMEPMVTPKSMMCGHSVCDKCEPDLWKDGGVHCPFCRKKTECKEAGQLPVNYGLLDVIVETKKREDKEKENDDASTATTMADCSSCSKRAALDSLFRCDRGGCEQAIICCRCSTRAHKGHKVTLLDDVVEEKKRRIRGWIDTSQMKEHLEKARTEQASTGDALQRLTDRFDAFFRYVPLFVAQLKDEDQDNEDWLRILQSDIDDFASCNCSTVKLCAADLPATFSAFTDRLNDVRAKRVQLSAKLTESAKAIDDLESHLDKVQRAPIQQQQPQTCGDGGRQDEYIKLKVVGQAGNEVHYRVKFGTQMGRLKQLYGQKTGVNVSSVRFLFDGRRISDDDTPRSLQMTSGDIIEAFQTQGGTPHMP